MRVASDDEFRRFFERAEPLLRNALVAAFGPVLGRDVTADALAWGWQHWDDLSAMDNPKGYLYRIGRNQALKELNRQSRSLDLTVEAQVEMPDFEPALGTFLSQLSESQRVAVWMVHGLGFTHREVADLLHCAPPTVTTHVRRALTKLRAALEVDLDV